MRKVSPEYAARWADEPDLVFSEVDGVVYAETVPTVEETIAADFAAMEAARWGQPYGDGDGFSECSHGHAFCTRH
jgi:hypothetical protein